MEQWQRNPSPQKWSMLLWLPFYWLNQVTWLWLSSKRVRMCPLPSTAARRDPALVAQSSDGDLGWEPLTCHFIEHEWQAAHTLGKWQCWAWTQAALLWNCPTRLDCCVWHCLRNPQRSLGFPGEAQVPFNVAVAMAPQRQGRELEEGLESCVQCRAVQMGVQVECGCLHGQMQLNPWPQHAHLWGGPLLGAGLWLTVEVALANWTGRHVSILP